MCTNVALPLPSHGNLSYDRHIISIKKKSLIKFDTFQTALAIANSNPLHRTALVMIPPQMFAHIHHIYDRQQMWTTKAAWWSYQVSRWAINYVSVMLSVIEPTTGQTHADRYTASKEETCSLQNLKQSLYGALQVSRGSSISIATGYGI
jgi:hypothetical protein